MTLWILEFNLPLNQHRPIPQDPMPRPGHWGCGQGRPWWVACSYQGLRSFYGGQPLLDQSHESPKGIGYSSLPPCLPSSKCGSVSPVGAGLCLSCI